MLQEGMNILVVDDDEVDRMALRRALGRVRKDGRVIEAGNAEEARKSLESEEVDCIFLDYRLPDSDGQALLAEFRRKGIDVPILILTGHGDAQLAVDLMQGGASDFLSKSSLSPELISRRLSNVLRIYEADSERRRAQEQQRVLLEQLREAQGQLLQSEKLASIGQLAAGVAHEINNPLGYINSNISTMVKYVDDLFALFNAYERAEDYLTDATVKADVQGIKERVDWGYLKSDLHSLLEESLEGVDRVRRIVEDLKDFSHVGEAEWQWADIHKGLESTLNIVHNELKYKAEVVKQYGELPPIECIASQINQVFMNLLVNAAQAIEQRGVITVRTGTEEDEWAWVVIQDTGKGITPDKLKRIFDPFFTTKPVGKGTGLGLSLSYGIINRHGGRMEVESVVGEGTTFQVWLPIKQPDAKAIP